MRVPPQTRPPWCYVSIRDITEPAVELEPGKTGGIAILDALNTAYIRVSCSPMTSGSGRQRLPMRWPQGRPPAVRRRRQGAELGCCAVSIEKYLDFNQGRARVRTRGHSRDGLTMARFSPDGRRPLHQPPATAGGCHRTPMSRPSSGNRCAETRFCSPPGSRGCRERHRLRGIRLFSIAGHRVDTHRAAAGLAVPEVAAVTTDQVLQWSGVESRPAPRRRIRCRRRTAWPATTATGSATTG